MAPTGMQARAGRAPARRFPVPRHHGVRRPARGLPQAAGPVDHQNPGRPYGRRPERRRSEIDLGHRDRCQGGAGDVVEYHGPGLDLRRPVLEHAARHLRRAGPARLAAVARRSPSASRVAPRAIGTTTPHVSAASCATSGQPGKRPLSAGFSGDGPGSGWVDVHGPFATVQCADSILKGHDAPAALFSRAAIRLCYADAG